jgi:hypothetical protein
VQRTAAGGGGGSGAGGPVLGSGGERLDQPPRHRPGSDDVFGSPWAILVARGPPELRT